MSIITYDAAGKPKINKVEAFTQLRKGNPPSNDEQYQTTFDSLDKEIKQIESNVKQGALNNCHGDWYEWILAHFAWNYRIDKSYPYLVLLLPNVSRFDVQSLYTPKIYKYITDFKNKAQQLSNVNLITSNPDFVIIDPNGLSLNSNFHKPLPKFNARSIDDLQTAYKLFEGECSIDNIVGYLSVKTSLRPDRRLQLAHEGSLVKAMYRHVQTREWAIGSRGVRYYAAATKIGPADIEGLKTVATHSITTIESKPQAAVDEVFQINSNKDASFAFDKMLAY